MRNLQNIITNLENSIDASNFSDICDSAVLEIEKLPSPKEAIAQLLSFMAKHPDLNYGMPGAFVHFIETFPEEIYVDVLIDSIKRQPTEHNTWMLLRIMNTWSSPRQKEYIQVMKNTLSHPTIGEDLKQTRMEYLQDFEE